jgi:hypothetical protein
LRAAWAGIAAALVAGLALAAGPTGQSATPRPSTPPAATATLGDCQNLLKQFDVAWPAHRDSARGASARHSRDLGEADCQAGRYADAVHNLRRALHDIGVKPVKIVSPAPQH